MCVQKYPGVSNLCVLCDIILSLQSKCAYGKILACKPSMDHIVCMSQYWFIFSCFPHIMLSGIRTRILLIHSPYTHFKTHSNHFLPGVCLMGLQNCFWCVFYSPPQHCWKKLPNKMVAKRHSFLVHGDNSITCIQHHTHVVQDTGVGLDTLITIDLRWYGSITESSTLFFSAMNLAPNIEVCNTVWIFDDHVVVFDSTTENKPVIDISVTMSWPCLSSPSTWMSNSSSRG